MVEQNGNIVMRLVTVMIKFIEPTTDQKLLNLKREGLRKIENGIYHLVL